MQRKLKGEAEGWKYTYLKQDSPRLSEMHVKTLQSFIFLESAIYK